MAPPHSVPAGGRVPGHQRRPVRTGAHAHPPGGALHGGGRRRPVDLRLARCAAGKPGQAAGRLAGPESGQAGAELPLHRSHSEGRQHGDRQQPPRVREEPVVRLRLRRGDPHRGAARRGRRDRLDRRGHLPPAPAARPALEGLRGALPGQFPVTDSGDEAAGTADSLQGVRRHRLFLAGRDQGPDVLPAPAGQPGRRQRLPARDQHAAPGDRPGHPGEAGRLGRPAGPGPLPCVRRLRPGRGDGRESRGQAARLQDLAG